MLKSNCWTWEESSDEELPNQQVFQIGTVNTNRLLDVTRLQTEAQQLENSLALLKFRPQRDHALNNTLDVAKALVTQSDSSIQTNEVPSGNNPSEWTNEYARSSLVQLLTSAELFSNCVLEGEKLSLLTGAMQLYACRCLISFFHWQINVAPCLAHALFHSCVYQNDLEATKKRFPAFAKLIAAIYGYASFLQCHPLQKKQKLSSKLFANYKHMILS